MFAAMGEIIAKLEKKATKVVATIKQHTVRALLAWRYFQRRGNSRVCLQQAEQLQLEAREAKVAKPIAWELNERRKLKDAGALPKRMERYDRPESHPEAGLIINDLLAESRELSEVQYKLKKAKEKVVRSTKKYVDLKLSALDVAELMDTLRAMLHLPWPEDSRPPQRTHVSVLTRALLSRIFTGMQPHQYDKALVESLVNVCGRSPAAYKALHALYNFLPTIRTIQATTNAGGTPVGFSLRAFQQMLAASVSCKDPHDFVGYLCTDDVDTQKAAVLSRADGKVRGVSSDESHQLRFTKEELEELASATPDSEVRKKFDSILADHVGQWYWTSLTGKFKFPIGHFYVRSEDAGRLHRQLLWLIEGITLLQAIGFRTWAIVNDSHQTNVQLRKTFTSSAGAGSQFARSSVHQRTNHDPCGACPPPPPPVGSTASVTQSSAPTESYDFSVKHPTESDPTIKLYFLPDNEHMLKAFRNAMFACRPLASDPSKDRRRIMVRFLEDGKEVFSSVRWVHWYDTYEFETTFRTAWRVAYKLTKESVYLDAWSQMRMALFDNTMCVRSAIGMITAFIEIVNRPPDGPGGTTGVTFRARDDSAEQPSTPVAVSVDSSPNHPPRQSDESVAAAASSVDAGRPDGGDPVADTGTPLTETQPRKQRYHKNFMSNPRATFSFTIDIACLGHHLRPAKCGGGGYDSLDDNRLKEVSDIYNEWSSNKKAWIDSLQKTATAKGKRLTSDELSREGVPDITLETLACWIGAFQGLLGQCIRVFPSKENPQVCAFKLAVPTQLHVEGLFGIVREYSANRSPSTDTYSRILAVLQQLQVSEALSGLSQKAIVDRILKELAALVAPAEPSAPSTPPRREPVADDEATTDSTSPTSVAAVDPATVVRPSHVGQPVPTAAPTGTAAVVLTADEAHTMKVAGAAASRRMQVRNGGTSIPADQWFVADAPGIMPDPLTQASDIMVILAPLAALACWQRTTRLAQFFGNLETCAEQQGQLQQYFDCLCREIEASFHRFVHPVGGAQRTIVARGGRVWYNRAKAFQRYCIDSCLSTDDTRWKRHCRGGSDTSALSQEERVVATYLFAQVQRCVALRLLDTQQWLLTDIPTLGAIDTEPVLVADVPEEYCRCRDQGDGARSDGGRDVDLVPECRSDSDSDDGERQDDSFGCGWEGEDEGLSCSELLAKVMENNSVPVTALRPPGVCGVCGLLQVRCTTAKLVEQADESSDLLEIPTDDAAATSSEAAARSPFELTAAIHRPLYYDKAQLTGLQYVFGFVLRRARTIILRGSRTANEEAYSLLDRLNSSQATNVPTAQFKHRGGERTWRPHADVNQLLEKVERFVEVECCQHKHFVLHGDRLYQFMLTELSKQCVFFEEWLMVVQHHDAVATTCTTPEAAKLAFILVLQGYALVKMKYTLQKFGVLAGNQRGSATREREKNRTAVRGKPEQYWDASSVAQSGVTYEVCFATAQVPRTEDITFVYVSEASGVKLVVTEVPVRGKPAKEFHDRYFSKGMNSLPLSECTIKNGDLLVSVNDVKASGHACEEAARRLVCELDYPRRYLLYRDTSMHTRLQAKLSNHAMRVYKKAVHLRRSVAAASGPGDSDSDGDLPRSQASKKARVAKSSTDV